MFEDLTIYSSIIVTGCQRAGTTICARAVAHDTGFAYIDEDEYGTTEPDEWRKLVRNRDKVVIHSPAMARYVHEFGRHYGVFVVWVKRPLSDVMASEARIGWSTGKAVGKEREKYIGLGIYDPDLPICLIKSKFWLEQRKMISSWMEVNYGDLQGHPLWVPPTERTDFDKRQWQAHGQR